MFNKKICKKIIAAVMSCVLAAGTAGINTTLAADKDKGGSIEGNIKPGENAAGLSKVMAKCEEFKREGSQTKFGKEQTISVKRFGSTTAVIMPNGDLYCWGKNEYGKVGNGSTENQLTPVKVLENVKSVYNASSDYYKEYGITIYYDCMLAITEAGDLYCWGDNESGQIGNGSTESQLTPVKVLENVKSVNYQLDTVTAITETGDLYCWGDNRSGKVGNGSTENQLTPVKVLENVKTVTLGGGTMTAITETGDLYCWGFNGNGEAGNGSTESQLAPVKVLGNVKTVIPGGGTMIAITETGDLYCWGYNGYGKVGNGSRKNQFTPVKILENVKTVIPDYTMTAITETGDLYCWGENKLGQIGNGSIESQLTPVKILENVKTVTLGGGTMTAITETGDLYCWGNNKYGQAGNGSTENQLTPVKVLGNVKAVIPGYTMTAITETGDLYCWGENGYGQAGNGSTENQLTPVKVLGNVKTVIPGTTMQVITETGELYCWGYNEYGKVGNGSTENQLKPSRIFPPGEPEPEETAEPEETKEPEETAAPAEPTPASDVIEVSTRQELYDAFIGLLCKEVTEDEDYDDEYYEDEDEDYDSDEDYGEKDYDNTAKENTADGDKANMVRVLNDEYEDLSNLPRIIIRGYKPSKFYIGEVLYDVNKYIVEKIDNYYGKYLAGSPVKVYDLKKKSLIKKDIKKPVDVYLGFNGVEWKEAGDGDDDSALKLPENGKIVKSNKEYYQYVLKCMKKGMDTITINKFYSYPYITPLKQVIQSCCDNNYELYSCWGIFAGSSKDIFSGYMIEEGTIANTPSKKDIKKGKKLEKEAEKVLKKIIKKGMSDTQKVKAIHSYLVKNCTYDTNVLSYVSYNGKVINNPATDYLSEKHKDMYTPYAAVVKKRAVCEGYAKAFNIMALRSGLKSITVSGTANGNGQWVEHMWNAVKINGKIKYVDVTFDDPLTIDYKNPFKHLINNKKVRTTYLLKDASAMKKNHKWNVKQVNKGFKYIETSDSYKMYNKYCA